MTKFDFEAMAERTMEDALARYVFDKDLDLTENERREAEAYIREIAAEYGPVVDRFPSWHPLVRDLFYRRYPMFPGVVEPIYFVNALLVITDDEGAEKVFRKFNSQYTCPDTTFCPEFVDIQLYGHETCSVLVRCEWDNTTGRDLGLPTVSEPIWPRIPTHLALPAMLQKELSELPERNAGERWETVAPFLLGRPCSNTESLFVTAETARAMKEAWDLLNRYEVFGPVIDDVISGLRTRR